METSTSRTLDPPESTIVPGGHKGGKKESSTDKITTKFTWDHKTVFWEIENVSEAIGRNETKDVEESSTAVARNNQSTPASPGQSYRSMLDIDYINCMPFEAGCHSYNKSLWSLSLYKQTNPTQDPYLGLSIHLLEIESDSGVNRRFHHNHSFDDFDSHGLYMKYQMSILSSRGTVLHKIENDSVINIMSGNSWGEDQFISLNQLRDPNGYYASGDKLRMKVDLWLFKQLSHTTNSPEMEWSLSPQHTGQHGIITHPSLGSQLLLSLWKNRDFTDANILCGEQSFAVHKCIITAASPVFKAMFTNDMTEASHNEVTILDADPQVLETMLEFIYTGIISSSWDWNNFNKIAEIINACEKYQIKGLKEISFEMICDRTNLTNVGNIAVLVHLYNAEEHIKGLVHKFIIGNMRALRQQADFVQLVNDYPGAFASVLLSNEFCKTESNT